MFTKIKLWFLLQVVHHAVQIQIQLRTDTDTCLRSYDLSRDKVTDPTIELEGALARCQDLTIIFSLFFSFLFLSTSAFGHRSSAHYIIRLIYLDHDHYLS